MDLRDRFLYWWPVTARVAGLLIGFYEMAVKKVSDPSMLGFAGALVIAPVVVDAQKRRNRKRGLEED